MSVYTITTPNPNAISIVSSDEGKVFIDQQSGDTAEEKWTNAIAAADNIAPPTTGRNVVLSPSARRYVFTQPGFSINTRHSILAPSIIVKREVHLQFNNPIQGQTFVRISGGFGQACSGIWVTCGADGAASVPERFQDLTAFNFDSVSSFRTMVLDCRLFGLNSSGVRVTRNGNQNTESCKFVGLNMRAAMPLIHESGDNCSYSNLDLTCWHDPSTDDLPEAQQLPGVNDPNKKWAAIQGGPTTVLDHIEFSGSTQRGNASIYFNGNVDRIGDSVIIKHFRDEQGYDDGTSRITFTASRTNNTGNSQRNVTFNDVQTTTIDTITGQPYQSAYNVQNSVRFAIIGGSLSGGGHTDSQPFTTTVDPASVGI